MTWSRRVVDTGGTPTGPEAHDGQRPAPDTDERTVMNPVKYLSSVGFKSDYAYIGAFVSIGLSLLGWLFSRGNKKHDKAQSDRWGIFIGHWAPTFMALGIALSIEEDE
jgi:hypothetical protein